MRGRAPCTLCALDPFANKLTRCFYSSAPSNMIRHSSCPVQPGLRLCSLQLGLAHRWRTPSESTSGAPTRQLHALDRVSWDTNMPLVQHNNSVYTLTVPLDIICSTLTLCPFARAHSPHSPPACSRLSNCCRRHKSVGVLTLSASQLSLPRRPLIYLEGNRTQNKSRIDFSSNNQLSGLQK
jgi:hypothetical protein